MVCVCGLDASSFFDAVDDRPWPHVSGADSSFGMDIPHVVPDGAAEIDGAICSTATEPTLFLIGDSMNFIHPGRETLTGGTWTSRGTPSSITIETDAGDAGSGYRLTFAAPDGSVLAPTFYPGAVRAGFNGDLPGLEVVGNSSGCDSLTGSFDVRELLVVDGGVTRITATFEQRCDMRESVLRGCVHFR